MSDDKAAPKRDFLRDMPSGINPATVGHKQANNTPTYSDFGKSKK